MTTEIGRFECLPEMVQQLRLSEGARVQVLIRGVERATVPASTCHNQFTARVLDTFFQEDHTLLIVQAGSSTFEFSLPVFPEPLDQVELCIPMEKIQLFPGEPCPE